MEIHKPKKVHSWRELVNEIGVIVISIVLALGAEQIVEAVHWHNEVAETREALNEEVARDIAALQRRLAVAPCLDRRLEDLRGYFFRQTQGTRAPPSAHIGQPQFFRMHNNVWDVAKTGQVAAHMPLQERLSYSRFYDALGWIQDRQDEESAEWTRLSELDDFGSLGEGDWVGLRQARARAAAIARKMDLYTQQVIDAGRAITAINSPSATPVSAEARMLCVRLQ